MATCTGPSKTHNAACGRDATYRDNAHPDRMLCHGHHKQQIRGGDLRPLRSYGKPAGVLVRLPGTSLRVTRPTRNGVVAEAKRRGRPVSETVRDILDAFVRAPLS